ncbi:hypothetical protein K8352_17565 [Flavobacteriaceae bacterium F89]|uniref:Methylamine utilisation protein MauE domain-containing protein n=1 Tax=Cerina litoralis TaxID=2874477 RepID=A0AAE3EY96_9FLAO|nr:MauE/DoxX family redox-associated membrane protein [Cerina litoralis]MCG2462574.1 hypothetical protein [Cerina litoralis]
MKRQEKCRTLIVESISILFILLFVYAGLTKFLEGHLFYDNIRNSPILGGTAIASLASWIIPSAELLVPVLLIWHKTKLIGLYGALGLMSLFTVYTVAIVFFSPYIPCSCGGVISLFSWDQHLIFNTIFLLLAILGVVQAHKEQRISKEMKNMKFSC